MGAWCCSDLHGCSWAVDSILSLLGSEDKLFFLGDAIDRGDNSFYTMLSLLLDDRVTFILGNHEDNLLYYEEMKSWASTSQIAEYLNFWDENGGATTYLDYENLSEESRAALITLLKNCPLVATYKREDGTLIKMSHSGVINGRRSSILESRTHYLTEQYFPKDTYIVHGHTPIAYMTREEKETPSLHRRKPNSSFFWYNRGHKCCIDMEAYATDRVGLLNLDTFDELVLTKEV